MCLINFIPHHTTMYINPVELNYNLAALYCNSGKPICLRSMLYDID